MLVLFVVVFPFVWMLPASLKDRTDIWSIPPRWLPTKWEWANFKALTEPDVNGGFFLRSVGVTLLVGVSATALNLAVNILAAFGFARHEFWGKRVLWAVFLFTMFVPGITVQITSIQVVTALGLTNSLWVLILPTAANAYNIFFFRQFFLMIPDSLEESAMLDGANRMQILFRIILPLSVTPVVVTGVGCFIGHWNSYIWPTLTIVENQERYRQVMQYVYMLGTNEPRDYGKVIAAALVAIAVPVVVFGVFQKKIVEGIALSGLK
jgi:multiple sugar transport system permease protein